MTTATTSMPVMATGTGRGKTLTAIDTTDYRGTMQRLYTWIQQQKAYEQAAKRAQDKAPEGETKDDR